LKEPIPIVSIVGPSNSGKTTLIERLIRRLMAKGYRVGTIKHNRHGFQIDHEGKDSWRHRQAGAIVTVIASPRQIAVIEDTDRDYDMVELADRFIRDVHIILVEGFKMNPFPKIEVFRAALGREPLCLGQDNVIAMAADHPPQVAVPIFQLDDIDGLAGFIEAHFLNKRRGPGGS
jgi:molybdopterin-guanine dinucleotide biosynthesis protein B